MSRSQGKIDADNPLSHGVDPAGPSRPQHLDLLYRTLVNKVIGHKPVTSVRDISEVQDIGGKLHWRTTDKLEVILLTKAGVTKKRWAKLSLERRFLILKTVASLSKPSRRPNAGKKSTVTREEQKTYAREYELQRCSSVAEFIKQNKAKYRKLNANRTTVWRWLQTGKKALLEDD